jgi:peptidoglycan/xylan/chitin deacetylase (PgdA/CDA1 family)
MPRVSPRRLTGALVGVCCLAGARAVPAGPSEPITHVETDKPLLAITFDACATPGGSYGFDRDVFDIVNSQHVPITVFVSGRWVDTHGDEMIDLSQDPLVEFGDHSYDHPHMTRVTPERMGAELDRTEAALARYGRRAVAFRPPFGEWNQRLVEVARAHGLSTVTWDVVSGDPSAHVTTEGMVQAVLNQAKPGSIIVFHINGRGRRTHEALPPILTALRERGFRFVTLTALFAARTPVAPPSLATTPAR